MRLRGLVLSTKRLRAGDAVSYGYTFRAESDTTVALITGGYAQGIMRALGNRASVEIDGRERPIVGRVAMDVCVVDLGGADAAVGTEATYFGGTGPAAPGLARWSEVTGLTMPELITVAGIHADRGWEA
jgi:alanine racemase